MSKFVKVKIVMSVALLVVGIVFAYRFFNPESELDKLEKAVLNSNNPELKSELAATKDRKAIGAVMRAYRKLSATRWMDTLDADLKKGIRWDTLVSAIKYIENPEDRDEYVAAFNILVEMGEVERAKKLAETLCELREAGGKAWRVAKKHSVAIAVRQATKSGRDTDDLWKWYLDNANWTEPYLTSMNFNEDGKLAGPELVLEYLKELRRNKFIYTKVAEEIEEGKAQLRKNDDGMEALGDEYGAAVQIVNAYHDILAPGAQTEDVPILGMIEIILLNQDYYDPAKNDKKRLEEKGDELVRMWKLHPAVWRAALSWKGAVQLWKIAPAEIDLALEGYAECGLTELIYQHYGESDALKRNAIEAVAKHGDVGNSVLAKYKDDVSFKQMLQNPNIGSRLVAYIVLRGPKEAFEKVEKDSRWLDEYLNPDGTIKPEHYDLVEMAPFVGGIWTFGKKIATNRPVTAGDIGWAAFDVADIIVTVASFGTATAATASIKTGAKTGAEIGAKEVAKLTVESAGKTTTKALVKGTVKSGGEIAVREAAKQASKRTAMGFIKMAVKSTGKAVAKTSRIVKESGAKFIRYSRTTQGMRVLRGASVAMMVVVVSERTVPRFKVMAPQWAAGAGAVVGDFVNTAVNTAATTMSEAATHALGIDKASGNFLNLLFAIVAVASGLWLMVKALTGRHAIKTI